MFIFPSQRSGLAPLPIQRGSVSCPLPLNILSSRCFVGPLASQHLADAAVARPAGALCDITLGLILFCFFACCQEAREREEKRHFAQYGSFRVYTSVNISNCNPTSTLPYSLESVKRTEYLAAVPQPQWRQLWPHATLKHVVKRCQGLLPNATQSNVAAAATFKKTTRSCTNAQVGGHTAGHWQNSNAGWTRHLIGLELPS